MHAISVGAVLVAGLGLLAVRVAEPDDVAISHSRSEVPSGSVFAGQGVSCVQTPRAVVGRAVAQLNGIESYRCEFN